MEPEGGLLNYGRILRLSAQKFGSDVVLEYQGRRYDYLTFNREVNGVAAALIADGIRTGDRVVLMSENTPNYVRVLFALAKLGAIPIPINTMLSGAAARNVLLA